MKHSNVKYLYLPIGNEIKLKMYALFKQATSGKVATKRPGMMDFVARAKWDAWNGLGDMTQEEAQQAYVKIVDDLVAEEVSYIKSGENFAVSYYLFFCWSIYSLTNLSKQFLQNLFQISP